MIRFLNALLIGLLLTVSTCNRKAIESTEIYEQIYTDNIEFSVDSLIKAQKLPFTATFEGWEVSYPSINDEGLESLNYATLIEKSDTLYILTVMIREGRDIITYRKEEKGEY